MKKVLITLVTAAATIVPAAQAAGPDDRPLPRATSVVLAGSVNPDDRSGNRATSPALRSRSLGADDRALSRATTDRPETPTPVQVVVRPAHGFDWGDATTGAVAASGFAAILAALVLITGRYRRGQGPQASPTVGSV